MKNKITMWCMLFALLVALVPPSSARANTTETTADDTKYSDIEDFMHSSGYAEFKKVENCVYFIVTEDKYFYVVEISNVYDKNPYFAIDENDGYFCAFAEGISTVENAVTYKYYNQENASVYNDYSCLEEAKSYNLGFLDLYFKGTYARYIRISDGINKLVYSDLDVYSLQKDDEGYYIRNYTESVLYESNIMDDDGTGGDTESGSGSGSEGGGTGGGTRPEGGTEDDGTLLENINSMVEMISAVPQIIKAVFSFLPAWCLTLVGIGFAIIVVIMVRRGTIG